MEVLRNTICRTWIKRFTSGLGTLARLLRNTSLTVRITRWWFMTFTRKATNCGFEWKILSTPRRWEKGFSDLERVRPNGGKSEIDYIYIRKISLKVVNLCYRWNRERQIRERLSRGDTFQLKNPFNPNPPVKMFIRAQLYALSDEVEGALDRGCLPVVPEQDQGDQTMPY